MDTIGHETRGFDARERAALALCEAMTHVAGHHVAGRSAA